MNTNFNLSQKLDAVQKSDGRRATLVRFPSNHEFPKLNVEGSNPFVRFLLESADLICASHCSAGNRCAVFKRDACVTRMTISAARKVASEIAR